MKIDHLSFYKSGLSSWELCYKELALLINGDLWFSSLHAEMTIRNDFTFYIFDKEGNLSIDKRTPLYIILELRNTKLQYKKELLGK